LEGEREEAALGIAGPRVYARRAATQKSCVWGDRMHFLVEAGTEVDRGTNKAHREWHRNRFHLLEVRWGKATLTNSGNIDVKQCR